MLYRKNHVAGLYAQLIKYLSNSFYNVTSLSAYLSHPTYWQLEGSEITSNAKAHPSLLKIEKSLTLSWWMQIEMLRHMLQICAWEDDGVGLEVRCRNMSSSALRKVLF